MSSRQKPNPYVVYHSPCIDGFSAAYAAWKKFGDHGARYVPMTHGVQLPEFKDNADIYFVDIVPKRDVLLELAKTREYIFVIDHHRSAVEDLRGIALEAPNIIVHFDMEHSAAVLTWYFFHPSGTLPKLMRNVEDRDLWLHKLPNSKAIHAALELYPMEFDVWDDLMTQPLVYSSLESSGRALLKREDFQCEAVMREVRAAEVEIDGELVVFPAVNANYFLASEVGNRLILRYPKAPFAGVYRDSGNGRRDWSLRSDDNRMDVAKVAMALGGGGHRNAAGFNEKIALERVDFLVGGSYDDYINGATVK